MDLTCQNLENIHKLYPNLDQTITPVLTWQWIIKRVIIPVQSANSNNSKFFWLTSNFNRVLPPTFGRHIQI